jgi:hypothetical protein
MGISKLLKLLEFGRQRKRLRDFAAGKTVAVDGFV